MAELNEVFARAGFAPAAWGQLDAPPEAFGNRWSPVPGSPDLDRVMALPRRPRLDLRSPRAAALVAHVNSKLRRPDGPCSCRARHNRDCVTSLLPVQAWALHEINTVGGIIGSIAVGGGKSFLDLLAPLAMPGCRVAVVLVPPALAKQIARDYDLLSQHFLVPSLEVWGASPARADVPGAPKLHVLPYSILSQPKSSVLLENIAPDVIIADEVHMLRDPTSARTRRVLRYFAKFGNTRFAGWSGSLTDSSLEDYGHLLALALRYGSPLPLDMLVLQDWSRAIDPSDSPADPGALLDSLVERGFMTPGEHVHDGFHRRLVETPGVVATTEQSVDVELRIRERPAPPIPEKVSRALDDLRRTWVRPDGEELVDALGVAKSARELACGFYYYWKFVHGETDAQIREWLAARKDWNCDLRARLMRGDEHMDSASLCEHAAQRAWGDRPAHKDRPTWRAGSWPRWRAVKNTVFPETHAERLDDYLMRDAAEWARGQRGLVWFASREVGMWIAQLSGLPMIGGGKDADDRIRAITGETSVIVSLASHGTGRDGFQFHFADSLVTQIPSSAHMWEQFVGRLARHGQAAPLVTAAFYAHTPELRASLEEAERRAAYVSRTMGAAQKLLAGRR